MVQPRVEVDLRLVAPGAFRLLSSTPHLRQADEVHGLRLLICSFHITCLGRLCVNLRKTVGSGCGPDRLSWPFLTRWHIIEPRLGGGIGDSSCGDGRGVAAGWIFLWLRCSCVDLAPPPCECETTTFRTSSRGNLADAEVDSCSVRGSPRDWLQWRRWGA